jgi:multidrug resistance efflux pump
MVRQGLFREEVVDRLTSPEQLDTMMRVVDPRRWIALAAVGVLLVGALIWAFVGRLDSSLKSSCMIVPRGGTYNVVTTTAGTVYDVLVQRGDHVNEGQPVVIVERPDGSQTPVNAPFSGTVIELLSTYGDYLPVGAQILNFESDEEEQGVLFYVNPAVAAGLRKGMDVRVSPTTASRDQYGFLVGKIDEIAPYPSTKEGMQALLHNDTLTDQLFTAAGGTPVEVWVQPEKAATPTGFRWSSSDGPTRLRSGATCSADIVLGERRPIDLVR